MATAAGLVLTRVKKGEAFYGRLEAVEVITWAPR
jgi:hypothetical protein